MKKNEDWKAEIINQELEEQKILELVKSKVTKEAFDEIQDNLNESGYVYNFLIADKPIGELQNCEDYEHIEGVYVNQTTNGGYSGDEFAGTCSIKIAENEYFQFAYSM
jgi:hypothetical protein